MSDQAIRQELPGVVLTGEATGAELRARLTEIGDAWTRHGTFARALETERSLLVLRLPDRRERDRDREQWRARQREYDRLERERRLLLARARGAR